MKADRNSINEGLILGTALELLVHWNTVTWAMDTFAGVTTKMRMVPMTLQPRNTLVLSIRNWWGEVQG